METGSVGNVGLGCRMAADLNGGLWGGVSNSWTSYRGIVVNLQLPLRPPTRHSGGGWPPGHRKVRAHPVPRRAWPAHRGTQNTLLRVTIIPSVEKSLEVKDFHKRYMNQSSRAGAIKIKLFTTDLKTNLHLSEVRVGQAPCRRAWQVPVCLPSRRSTALLTPFRYLNDFWGGRKRGRDETCHQHATHPTSHITT